METRIKKTLLSSMLIIFIIAVLFDTKVFSALCYLNTDFFTVSNTVFQIQATVAVLSPTLISLLSVFNKEKYFGVPLSKYVMFIRPGRLNYIFYTLLLFLGIIISYYLLILGFLNSIAIILFISVFLALIMAFDIFFLYRRQREAIEGLRGHIQRELNQGDRGTFNIVCDDMRENLANNNFQRFEMDLEIIVEAYERFFDEE